MNAVSVAGGTLTVVGVAGYLVGIVAPYPGRAFSVTGVMVGITLLAIGRNEDSTDRGDGRSAGRESGQLVERGDGQLVDRESGRSADRGGGSS